jgi:anthranilate phosphoribosyltransferase
LVEPLAQVLGNLGSSRAFVVHGADGLDEITTAGETHIAALDHGTVSTFTVRPEQFGLPRVPLEALAGGDAQQNARITSEILDGKPGPQRDVVLLNAAAALVVAGAAADWHAGLQLAAEAIDSGAALDKLRGLQRFAG